MSKESQKRIIQINHGLSGLFGEEIKATAFRINDVRKQLLKKLERKKKLSPIIHDELYNYLEKFPQQRLGLHQESFKKKKARLSESEERPIYRTPLLSYPQTEVILNQRQSIFGKLQLFFQYQIQAQSISEESKQINQMVSQSH